jgi:hypothetical protein
MERSGFDRGHAPESMMYLGFGLAVLSVFDRAQVGDIPLRWATGRVPSFEGGRDDSLPDVFIVRGGHATALASLGRRDDQKISTCGNHQLSNQRDLAKREMKHGIPLKHLGKVQRIIVPSLGTYKRS